MSELTFTVPPELVEQVAQRVAEILAPRFETAASSPLMTIAEAAEYLRCKRQRVDDLLSSGRLTRHKDGSRTLVSRAELEEYVGGSRGVAPASVTPLPTRAQRVSSG